LLFKPNHSLQSAAILRREKLATCASGFEGHWGQHLTTLAQRGRINSFGGHIEKVDGGG
jgi:hypothetical protein